MSSMVVSPPSWQWWSLPMPTLPTFSPSSRWCCFAEVDNEDLLSQLMVLLVFHALVALPLLLVVLGPPARAWLNVHQSDSATCWLVFHFFCDISSVHITDLNKMSFLLWFTSRILRIFQTFDQSDECYSTSGDVGALSALLVKWRKPSKQAR